MFLTHILPLLVTQLPLPEGREAAAMTWGTRAWLCQQTRAECGKDAKPIPPTRGPSKLKVPTTLVTTPPIQVKQNRHWLATFFPLSDRL